MDTRIQIYSSDKFFITAIALVFLLSACGSAADHDKTNFESDTAAVTEVRRIQASLGKSPVVVQSDLDLLKSIHKKYPGAEEVSRALQTALQSRQDWSALLQLLSEKPEAQRTHEDKVFLGKILIKLGRYAEASEILGPMAETAPNDRELNSLAGHAWYYEGRYDEAARAFDRIWDAIVAAKQIDEIMLRGMIYFYKGDRDRAIELLKKTIEINPDYIAGLSALSRVYSAKGDSKQAEYYASQAQNIHERVTADEARLMRLSSRSRDLEQAWNRGDYEACISIAQELLPMADPAQKAVLYDYLGQAYRATGRQTEAQEAFQQAARLRQNPT